MQLLSQLELQEKVFRTGREDYSGIFDYTPVTPPRPHKQTPTQAYCSDGLFTLDFGEEWRRGE